MENAHMPATDREQDTSAQAPHTVGPDMAESAVGLAAVIGEQTGYAGSLSGAAATASGIPWASGSGEAGYTLAGSATGAETKNPYGEPGNARAQATPMNPAAINAGQVMGGKTRAHPLLAAGSAVSLGASAGAAKRSDPIGLSADSAGMVRSTLSGSAATLASTARDDKSDAAGSVARDCAAALQLSAEEAGRLILRLQKAYSLNTRELRSSVDMIIHARNLFEAGEKNLVSLVTDFSLPASQAGVRPEELATVAAAVAAGSGDENEAADALKRIMLIALERENDATEFLDALGTDTGAAVSELLKWRKNTQKLLKSFGKTAKKAGKEFLPLVQAVELLSSLRPNAKLLLPSPMPGAEAALLALFESLARQISLRDGVEGVRNNSSGEVSAAGKEGGTLVQAWDKMQEAFDPKKGKTLILDLIETNFPRFAELLKNGLEGVTKYVAPFVAGLLAVKKGYESAREGLVGLYKFVVQVKDDFKLVGKKLGEFGKKAAETGRAIGTGIRNMAQRIGLGRGTPPTVSQGRRISPANRPVTRAGRETATQRAGNRAGSVGSGRVNSTPGARGDTRSGIRVGKTRMGMGTCLCCCNARGMGARGRVKTASQGSVASRRSSIRQGYLGAGSGNRGSGQGTPPTSSPRRANSTLAGPNAGMPGRSGRRPAYLTENFSGRGVSRAGRSARTTVGYGTVPGRIRGSGGPRTPFAVEAGAAVLPGSPRSGAGRKRTGAGRSMGRAGKVGIGLGALVLGGMMLAPEAQGTQQSSGDGGAGETGGSFLSMAGSAGLAVDAIGTLADGMFLASQAMSIASMVSRGLGVALMANPMGLILGGIALAAGLIISNWSSIKGYLAPVLDWLGEAFGWIGGLASGLLAVPQMLVSAWGSITAALKPVFTWLGDVFGFIAGSASPILAIPRMLLAAWGAIGSALEPIFSWLGSKFEFLGKGAKMIGGLVGKVAGIFGRKGKEEDKTDGEEGSLAESPSPTLGDPATPSGTGLAAESLDESPAATPRTLPSPPPPVGINNRPEWDEAPELGVPAGHTPTPPPSATAAGGPMEVSVPLQIGSVVGLDETEFRSKMERYQPELSAFVQELIQRTVAEMEHENRRLSYVN